MPHIWIQVSALSFSPENWEKKQAIWKTLWLMGTFLHAAGTLKPGDCPSWGLGCFCPSWSWLYESFSWGTLQLFPLIFLPPLLLWQGFQLSYISKRFHSYGYWHHFWKFPPPPPSLTTSPCPGSPPQSVDLVHALCKNKNQERVGNRGVSVNFSFNSEIQISLRQRNTKGLLGIREWKTGKPENNISVNFSLMCESKNLKYVFVLKEFILLHKNTQTSF